MLSKDDMFNTTLYLTNRIKVVRRWDVLRSKWT